MRAAKSYSTKTSVALLLILSIPRLFAQYAVTTGHYDNHRTGANTHEFILTPANVNRTQFGKLGSLPVSGCIFAQPLYVPGVLTSGGVTRDLVFIATTTSMVYAYDANDYSLLFSGSYGIPVPSSELNP